MMLQELIEGYASGNLICLLQVEIFPRLYVVFSRGEYH